MESNTSKSTKFTEDWQVASRFWRKFQNAGLTPDLIEQSPFVPSSPILVVGCGAGLNLDYFRQQRLAVEGCDSSEAMISLCRQENLPAKLGSAHQLPYNSRQFSSLVLATGILDSSELELCHQQLQEAERVLAPGSKLLISYFACTPNLKAISIGLGILDDSLFINGGKLYGIFQRVPQSARRSHSIWMRIESLKSSLMTEGFDEIWIAQYLTRFLSRGLFDAKMIQDLIKKMSWPILWQFESDGVGLVLCRVPPIIMD